MKLSVFLMLFTLMSCGIEIVEPERPIDSRIGNVWEASTSDKFSTNEEGMIEDFCLALADKENYFKDIVVTTNNTFVFDLNEAQCGSETGTKATIEANLELNSGTYEFISMNRAVFRDVITKDSTLVRSICNPTTTATGVRGVVTGNRATRHYFYKKNARFCKSTNDDEICMIVEYAEQLKNGKFKTKDITAIRVLTEKDHAQRGFVLERSILSASKCAEENELYLKEQFFSKIN